MFRVPASCTTTAEQAEAYIEAHLFDDAGLLRSAVDVRTGQPFAADLVTPLQVPRHGRRSPWAWWTYDDTIAAMGLYIDALTRKYEVTGEGECLDRAEGVWNTLHRVYAASQVFGIGSFLRPYGGFGLLGDFREPLGVDQASPLCNGLCRYWQMASAPVGEVIFRVMRQSLEWYAAQDFTYWHRQAELHTWDPADPASRRANSYYLPMLAWVAKAGNDRRWHRLLESRLDHFCDGDFNLFESFPWGSELPNLAELLGETGFATAIDDAALAAGRRRCLEQVAACTEPGRSRRVCPESATPGFRAEVDPRFDPHSWRQQPLGFAALATRHGGRERPRHLADFLLGLAAIGHERPASLELVAELLSAQHRVPEDFTVYLHEDYEHLPPTVHLYARSVGLGLVQWWRNYWFLRQLAEQEAPEPSPEAPA